jgi:hypothetical protein
MTAPTIGHGDLAEELGLVHAAVTRQSAGLLSLDRQLPSMPCTLSGWFGIR